MERVEEFSRDGKNIVYIDFSGLTKSGDFVDISEKITSTIAKYPEHSVYTITNIENIRLDSNSKKLVLSYLENNHPYVKYGVIIGLDGIKKMLVSSIMKQSGRSDYGFAFTKKGAIDFILHHE